MSLGSEVRPKTDGQNTEMVCAGGFDSLTAEWGIVTNYSCASPEASPVMLKAHIQTLEARIAQLEAQVALLLEEARKR